MASNNPVTSFADFKWYNYVDDKHPIGQSLPILLLQPTLHPLWILIRLLAPPVGPFDCAQLLHGHTKPAIKMSPTGQTPAQAVAKAQCNNSKKQPYSGDDNGPV